MSLTTQSVKLNPFLIPIVFIAERLHDDIHCTLSVSQEVLMFVFPSLFLTDLNSAMKTQFTSGSTSRLALGQNLDFFFRLPKTKLELRLQSICIYQHSYTIQNNRVLLW